MRRERAAQQPQDFSKTHRLLGPLRSPFATQGRSYTSRIFAGTEYALFLVRYSNRLNRKRENNNYECCT